MALPEEFNSFEHLQSVFRRTHNEIVRDEFSDILDDDDISTPRSSLKVACLVTDNDNDAMMNLRLWLFYVIVRKAQDFQAPIYGVPVSDFHEEIKYRPQVTLHFMQDLQAVPSDYSPVRARISFRLYQETENSLSMADATTMAQRVKSEFATGSGYVWTRGRIKVCYRDPIKGYDFRLLVPSESEGRSVIQKVMSLQNHGPDWDNLTVTTPERTYSQNPGTQLILGKTYRKPRQRPNANVRFRYATLSVHGLPHDIVLCDLTGFYKKALVR